MRLCFFLLGLLVGLTIAPTAGRTSWRWLRNRLAASIDAGLRIGIVRELDAA